MGELIDLSQKAEKAIAVAYIRKGSNREDAYEYLEELCELAITAGAEIVDKYTQELERPNKATLIGKGKVQEIKDCIEDTDIKLVLFDNELSPMQLRNLEKALGAKVLDRSGLILDIFASRAKTLEAKTQVELAQMQYLLPKLSGMWTHLSKQFGGIGSKGPGETQIETDRRIVRNKIQYLKEKLKSIETIRQTQRKGRLNVPSYALVGYTNAGKSTLMKAITEFNVYIEDELFATLDTTVKGFELPGGKKAILSDTVGFIRKLPHHLIASFRSTLAEAADADVLIHIVDVSHEYFRDHLATVEATLKSLDIVDIPTILVFNKIDKLEETFGIASIKEEYPNSIFISATRNINIQALLQLLQDKYEEGSNETEIFLPYSQMGMLNQLFQYAEILEQTDKDEGSEYRLRIHRDKIDIFNNVFGNFLL